MKTTAQEHNQIYPSSDTLLNRYQRLVEAAGDVIYSTDMNGYVDYINASVERIFGYSPEQVIGQHFSAFVHPDWKQKVIDHYAQQFKTRLPETILEFPILTASGEAHWVEQVVIAVIEHERVTGFNGFMRDISRRRKVEQQLDEQERLFRAIIENASDSVFVKDLQGQYLLVNPAFARSMGHPVDEMIGKTDHQLMDTASADYFSKTDQEIVSSRTTHRYEDRTAYHDGEHYFSTLKFPLMGDGGDVQGVVGIVRDITELKHIEQALRDSQQQYQALFEQIDDAITIHDMDANILEVNDAACRRLGYSREELLQMKTTDIDAPDYAAGFKDRLERQIAEGKLSNISGVHLTKDGRRILIDVNTRAITYKGKPAVLAVVRDITQIRLNEESLRRSEERYRMIVEDQTELICRWRADTTLTYVNDAYCRAFDKSWEELEGISFLTMVPESYHAGILAQIERSLATGETVAYEHTVVLKNGRVRWQEWTDRPLFDAEGKFLEFQSVGRDITERKLAENERNDYIHRLEIIQNVDTALIEHLNIDYVADIALKAAVSISQADAGAIHFLAGDQLKVAYWIGNFPPTIIGEKFPLTHGIVGRVARQRIPELVNDVTGDPDYVHNIIETRAQMTLPLLTQNQLIGVLNVQTAQPDRFTPQMFDFLKVLTARIASALENAQLHQTTEKQLTELQELYRQVSNLEQLKTQMIRIAAHDLRNPLGVISGYLQMLNLELGKQLPERNQQQLDIMGDSVNRIDRITRNILTLERISSGRDIQADSLDLRQLVSQTFEESRPQAMEKAIDYQLQLPLTALYVSGDRYLLPETALNLIANAIKYTADGGRVYAKLYTEQHCAVFEVEDTGFGIPEDQQSQLFEPFFRAKTKETRDIPGTGLGLHLVKTIIERHSGKMRFRSVYGHGSMFGFELPLIAAPKDSKKRRPAART